MCCRCDMLNEIEDIKRTIDKWEMRIRKDCLYHTECGRKKFDSDIAYLKQQRNRIDEILYKYDKK